MTQQIRFGTFLLDSENERLTQSGEHVGLRPKAFLLLDHLARRPGELATKEALLDALWPGVHVSDAVLKVAIGELRRALGDTPRSPKLIETVHRRGYRFIGDSQLVESAEPMRPVEPEPLATTRPVQPDRTSPEPGTDSDRNDFVGRSDALSQIEARWEQVLNGQTGVVLITGRAGIGKSRLVQEFLERGANDDRSVSAAHGTDRDALPGFFMWSQILTSMSEHAAFQDDLSRLNRNPEIVRMFPALAANRHTGRTLAETAESQQTPAERRFELFGSISRFLEGCAVRAPLVIVLEDLHWADALSVRLFDHLVSEIHSARILFLITLRDGTPGVDRPVDRTVALLRRLDRCDTIALTALSRDSIRHLFAAWVGRPVSTDLADQIFERTEGVPFFVREAIRLHEESSDFRDPERTVRNLPLPERTIDLLRRSLDELSEGARAIIGAGAVLGREFLLTQAAAIAERSREQALDDLEEAIRAGVLIGLETTVATYRFSHALFYEAVYDGLSVARRARLHQRAAARLETQYEGALDPVLSELAHHLHRGLAVADPDRCYVVANQAGSTAERRLAYEEAALHYEQAQEALEHCDRVDPERRLATLLSLGHAHRLAGEHRRRRDAFRRAIEAARSLGAAVELAQAAIGFCNVAEWAPDDAEGREIIEEALAGLSQATPISSSTVERARLTARLAYLRSDERQPATSLAEEAVGLARESAAPEAIQEALYALRFITESEAAGIRSEEDLAEMVDAARRSPNRDAATLAVLHTGYRSLAEGDVLGCEGMRALAGDLAGPTLNLRWYLAVWDTGMALMKGDFTAAEAMAIEALSIGQRTQHPFAAAIFNGHMAQLARERGDFEELVRRLQPAVHGRLGATHWLRALVARGQIELGETEAARALFEELAADDFADMMKNRRSIGTLPEVAFLAVELRDRGRAEILLDQVRRTPSRHGVFAAVVNYAGPYRWCEARLGCFVNGPTVDSALYAEALSEAERVGALPTAARICLDWAERASEAGARDEARQQANAGEALGRRLGMTGMTTKVARSKEQLL